MGLRYSDYYTVPFYECDVNQDMRLSALLSLALQVSGKQSQALGMSDEIIYEQYGLIWVVTEYTIEINRLPRYTNKIKIETEAISYNKLFCYRDFVIYDEDSQEKLLTIHASFILMDFKTRKVHPVEDAIVHVYQSEKRQKIEKSPKIPEITNGENLEFWVRYHDLDINQHVNNGKYLEWLYDSLGLDFLLEYIPKYIQLKYSKEIHYGHFITSTYEKDGNKTYHRISSDLGQHASAQIEWRKRENKHVL